MSLLDEIEEIAIHTVTKHRKNKRFVTRVSDQGVRERHCLHCYEWMPEVEFHRKLVTQKSGRRTPSRQSYCKSCQAEVARRSYTYAARCGKSRP